MCTTSIRAATDMVLLPRKRRSSNFATSGELAQSWLATPLQITSRLELKENQNGLSYISPIGIDHRNAFTAFGVPCILCRESLSLTLSHQS